MSAASASATASRRATLSVGLTVGLSALGMTFAALLLAYAIVRVQAPAWPPRGEAAPPSPWPWPLLATAAALLGSGAIESARRGLSPTDGRGRARRNATALVAAAGAGVAFLGLQLASCLSLRAAGVTPRSGLVASVVYALTLFHALHAFVALVVLAPALVRARRGRADGPRLGAVAAFWHLVTALWLAVFLAVYVI